MTSATMTADRNATRGTRKPTTARPTTKAKNNPGKVPDNTVRDFSKPTSSGPRYECCAAGDDGSITFVISCPAIEDWELLKSTDDFLETFTVFRFSQSVIATRETWRRELLKRFMSDPSRKRTGLTEEDQAWVNQRDERERQVLHWLETSPIAARFPNR
jgi:hypothetical protein